MTDTVCSAARDKADTREQERDGGQVRAHAALPIAVRVGETYTVIFLGVLAHPWYVRPRPRFIMITFLYGKADFALMRRMGTFYVDKTPFLPILEHPTYGGPNLVFLRPRRFGKSSLVSMMEHYYDISLSSRFDELFRGLWVYENPTPEKSKYIVLSFNFSTVSVDGDERALKANFTTTVRTSLKVVLQRYRGRNPALDEFAGQVNNFDDPAALMDDFLGLLAGTSDQFYVIIDEYDTFANALLSTEKKDMYERITDKMGFVRAFYRTLKAGADRGAIARIFITGGTPILLDDLMTGFNVARNVSNEPQFNALAGFTKVDVARAVDEVLRDYPDVLDIPEVKNRDALLDVLEHWYNGYRFAEDAPERVFNSTMVVYFMQKLLSRRKFPREMLDANARTDYQKLHGLWAAAGPAAEERRAVLQEVLENGRIWSPLVDRFGVRSISTAAQFVSLMYYTGMLTLAPEPPDIDLYLFDTPNRVIRELSWEHYTRLLEDLDGIQLTGRSMSLALVAMTKHGDMNPLLDELRKHVLPVLSVRDLRKHDEKAMKMLLIGAIVTSGLYHVLSEKEFGQGFNDLFMSPVHGVHSAKYAWMLELKYLATGASDAEKKAACEQAEKQLHRYAADPHLVPMLTRGLGLKAATVLFVGGKEVEWLEVAVAAG